MKSKRLGDQLRFTLALVSAACGVVALEAQPARAQADSILVHCRVFHDLNEDGVRQGGEPDLSGIWLTNGVAMDTTGIDGALDLWVDRALYRFATLTIPPGFWPTTSWYHWVPVGTFGPDSVEFGLKSFPETASDPIRWGHITDTGIPHPYDLDMEFESINALADPPLFLINTGDLVDIGSDSTHWEAYESQIAVSDFTVFPVVGNHDTLGTGPPLANYEKYAGPPYYNMRMGSWNFVVYNVENEALGTPVQDTWMDAMFASLPPATSSLVFMHRTLYERTQSQVAHWATNGVVAAFSGHWHARQFSRHSAGILDFNLTRFGSGALDRTPRVFGIVNLTASGEVEYEIRRFDVDHRSEITHPSPGQVLSGDFVEVLVQAYDTSSRVASLSASITGPGGSVPSQPLVQEGVSLWRGMLDVTALPLGDYDVIVSGGFADGQGIGLTTNFERSDVAVIVRSPDTDWPMFRKSAAGSSFTAVAVEPPLELAWTVPLPGMVALSSPIVSNGKVYLGCRSESGDPEDGGVIACDAATGAIEWFAPMSGGVALAPAISENVLVATSMTDSVFGFDATTGAELWRVKTPGGLYKMVAPIISGTDAIVGGEPRVQRVQWSSGTIDWTSSYLGSNWFPFIYSTPVVSDDYVFVSFYGTPNINPDGFSILDRQSGLWTYRENGTFRSPIWTGDTLYVVGAVNKNNQDLTARDEFGSVLWTATPKVGSSTGAPALGHGILVLPGEQGAIEGFQASDGTHLWSHPVGVELYDMKPGLRRAKDTFAAPAITDEIVYIGSLDGYLYALDLATGVELWKWYFGTPVASSAAASGNMIFVGASDGHLYAFVSALSSPAVDVSVSSSTLPFALAPPRPNPSVSTVRLEWSLPSRSHTRLRVFDVAGRLVTTLVDEPREAGSHHVRWNGRDRRGEKVAAGIYFAKLEAAGRAAVRKLVHLKK